jgi:4-hydroxy-3-polyprenylbenzoate decarboxylase
MSAPQHTKRLIVGISGASGAAYGVTALRALAVTDIETHVVITKAAVRTIIEETTVSLDEVRSMADVVHNNSDIGASIASGSFITAGMLVAPCSVRTASEIAWGVTSSLLTRAADVTLKELRRLVLMFRETPLHSGHLRTLAQLTDSGAIVMPPVPALYAKPQSVQELIDHSVGRALDLLGVDVGLIRRWKDDASLVKPSVR